MKMTSSEMTSFCKILGFGEVIWLEGVGNNIRKPSTRL